jgi:predicted P-loop ATPase
MVAIAVSDLAARLNNRIGDLAREFLGEPNHALSTKIQLRFGTKGSVAVEIDGPDAGKWFDHEAGVGGDGLELIRHHRGVANGEACDWAREWLGLEAARPPYKSKSGAEKVAEIVARSEGIVGTRVETYLRRRGITANPPDCIRFRRFAAGQHGALVALATDAEGAVLAVQQIYLTEDGRKAPVDVIKRTNKAVDGWSQRASMRLPGSPPVVLCEGVETALSVWQSTGQETWACFGITNISRAPVPEGAPLIVARDGDEPGSKGDQQIRRSARALRAQGRDVRVASPPPGMDFNDVLQKSGGQAVRDMIAAAKAADPSSAWRHGLLLNDEGEPRPILANAIHALRKAPEWDGVLSHDAFATVTVARQAPPWAACDSKEDWTDTTWSDRDDYLVAEWLQHQSIMVPASIAGQAVETVARDHLFHPVQEYLDDLVWDGLARLDGWLITYLGAVDTLYVRAIGSRWLISAVARIYVPGCQADCALILEGPQGIRKSSALAVLARPWFTDRLSDLGSKDAALETRGVWIIELAELDTMSRAEVGTIKAFMSRRQDRYRPPYGKRPVDLPRQCVFAGSINPEGGYLKDATGGRRFWPVVCGTIDLDALKRDRDQLWAEARDRFRRHEPWWLETRELDSLAAEQQAERYQGDAWDDPIRAYLSHEIEWLENGYNEQRPFRRPRTEPLDDVSVGEVLEQALRIERGRWSQADQNRVVRCLVSMGFKQYRTNRDQGRERRYRRGHLQSGPGGPAL